MTIHHASCHCRQLSLDCEGNPTMVALCHCKDCQRRTGSAIHLGAWFARTNTKLTGEYKIYTTVQHDGLEMAYHFCPTCGSNLFWTTPKMPGAMGVAVGCFADPQFPQPKVSFYENQRHAWLTLPENIKRLVEGGQ